jgi:hypothetical protein
VLEVGGHRPVGGLLVAGLKRVEDRVVLDGRRDDPPRRALQQRRHDPREPVALHPGANVTETLAQDDERERRWRLPLFDEGSSLRRRWRWAVPLQDGSDGLGPASLKLTTFRN